MNEYSTAIKKYQIIINQKDIEIKHLKSQLNNHNTTFNNDIKFCNYVDFNEIVCVNFLSSDNDIHFAISCLKSNTFAEIEENYICIILNIGKQIINLLLMENKY